MSIKCPQCHFENPNDTLFCGKCGIKLAPPEELSIPQAETLFFDESGTPADLRQNGLFVIGGLAIRGNTGSVVNNWNMFLDEKKLHGKKGRKYSRNQLLDVAEFLCINEVIPITAHSYIDENDLALLETKIDQYKKISKQIKYHGIRLNPATYLWCMHVGITIASSVASLLLQRGPITHLKISVDKYLSEPKLKDITQNVTEKFFSPSSLEQLCKPLMERYQWHPDMKKFLSNIKYIDHDFVKLDWNSKGNLAILADVVCALYRRALKRDNGAQESWGVLKICFGKKSGKITPGCMGNDITSSIREIIRAPWSRYMRNEINPSRK